jgi:hypothetical protein
MATAADASLSPSDELDRPFIPERLALRDLGEGGRSNFLSCSELLLDLLLVDSDRTLVEPERADLLVLLDEALDFGDRQPFTKSSEAVMPYFGGGVSVLVAGWAASVMADHGKGSGRFPIGVPGVQAPADAVRSKFSEGRQK